MTVETGETVAKDPDALAREIEATRAELAETIDAIADKVSPRRAVERGQAKVKETANRLMAKVSAGSPAHRDVTDHGGTTYATRRVLRVDRVAAVAGAMTAATAIVVVIRRRRRRSATLLRRS